MLCSNIASIFSQIHAPICSAKNQGVLKYDHAELTGNNAATPDMTCDWMEKKEATDEL